MSRVCEGFHSKSIEKTKIKSVQNKNKSILGPALMNHTAPTAHSGCASSAVALCMAHEWGGREASRCESTSLGEGSMTISEWLTDKLCSTDGSEGLGCGFPSLTQPCYIA